MLILTEQKKLFKFVWDMNELYENGSDNVHREMSNAEIQMTKE